MVECTFSKRRRRYLTTKRPAAGPARPGPLAILVGTTLQGLLGAVLAVPVAGAVDVIIESGVLPLRLNAYRHAEGGNPR
jgi:hypothetical protein